jgi:hypothetical protein
LATAIEFFKRWNFFGSYRDNNLATPLMGYLLSGTKLVKQFSTIRAETSFGRPRFVIKPGMYDSRIIPSLVSS